MITPSDWKIAGYRRFSQVKHVRDYAAFGLQKLFSDTKGKRYYLTVFVYDNKELNKRLDVKLPEYSYEPDVQFCFECKPTINIQLSLNSDNWSIAEVEQQIENLWVTVGKPYYEDWSE